MPHAVSALPARHRAPEQHPSGQLVPSHRQAPPTQRWPSWQGAPLPQAHPPSAEQLSLERALQITHGAPAFPQAAAPGTVQAPVAQQPFGQVAPLQAAAPSRRHSGEQPSLARVLPSSHSSIPSRTTPSPQIAGAPSVSVIPTSCPLRTTTAC